MYIYILHTVILHICLQFPQPENFAAMIFFGAKMKPNFKRKKPANFGGGMLSAVWSLDLRIHNFRVKNAVIMGI